MIVKDRGFPLREHPAHCARTVDAKGRWIVLSRLFAKFQPDPLRERVEDSIRRGTGLRRGEWLLDDPPVGEAAIEHVTDELLEWCRGQIANTRRPYGIDQLALAVACAVPGGQPLASQTFGVFRPVEFYAEGGVADRVASFMRSIRVEEINRRATPIRFAAALFSWGDVARETMFDDEAER